MDGNHFTCRFWYAKILKDKQKMFDEKIVESCDILSINTVNKAKEKCNFYAMLCLSEWCNPMLLVLQVPIKVAQDMRQVSLLP